MHIRIYSDNKNGLSGCFLRILPLRRPCAKQSQTSRSILGGRPLPPSGSARENHFFTVSTWCLKYLNSVSTSRVSRAFSPLSSPLLCSPLPALHFFCVCVIPGFTEWSGRELGRAPGKHARERGEGNGVKEWSLGAMGRPTYCSHRGSDDKQH